ncbi:uncharacterized protein BO72DRAFT_492794 [Aspergillus fijiensis CBS 313.89]|uniref:Uncharacterized protein n=1 Tax=Aspergillus fijiensis CBS 313.89 TaxID=1448319 RepID=A0A8G1W1V2_9EURO|nr:uncharacterized protein BO72DRAFT_492794 [Aspergillus fijiensis CBS 313.89]RAK80807.1 hypothetical protein BO72DRAFT_492794 [Aspergillus fijiensis CBS 313.89]
MTQIAALINQLAVLTFTLIMTTNLAPGIKRHLTAITDSSPLAAGLLLYCSISYLINHSRCGLLVSTYFAQLYSTIAIDYLWNLLFWKTLPATGLWARALRDELSLRKDLCVCEGAATVIQWCFDPYARVLLVCEWMGFLCVGIYSTVIAAKAVYRLLGEGHTW